MQLDTGSISVVCLFSCKMTTNDVEPVLRSILEKGSVLQFNDYVDTINYDVVLRTQLNDGPTQSLQCDNWVAKFSAVTNSSWIVKNTSPYAVRVLYKKSYTCKNKKCSAKINIIFKKNNRNTRKNDPLLVRGLNAVVKIIFKHNHDVYCPALKTVHNKVSQTCKCVDDSNNSLPQLEPIKKEDIAEEYSMDSHHSDFQDNDSDGCKDSATEEAMKLINLPMDYADNTELEISRFKGELQRISNIVEDDKSPQMMHYLMKLNTTLELINSSQDFYDQFSKIFNM